MKHVRQIIFVFNLLTLLPAKAHARPEYAVRYGLNRCTACHVSPAGGGPRNLMGKAIGAFGHTAQRWSQQDYAGADVKMIYFIPQKVRSAKGGLGLMNGEAWISLPVLNNAEGVPVLRLVAEQNLGGFNAGPRAWYGRLSLSAEASQTWTPQYIVVGRFIPPFGAMTDEHMTYTRLQTGTPWNTGFDTGILLSANPVESLHYDLAFVNGRKNSGQGLGLATAEEFGGILNLRWMPREMPFIIGASASWYPANATSRAAEAVSIYTVHSLHRWTNNRVPMSLTFEAAQASHWNQTFTSTFVSDANYASTLSDTTSQGLYGLMEYDFSSHWVGQYKFDYLVLNRQFPADFYQRHGAGAKYRFADNMWAILRLEKAIANHPAERDGTKAGALSAAWALVSISL